MMNYDAPPRMQRHHSADGLIDYKVQQGPPTVQNHQLPPPGPSHSSSASHLYQQPYALSRSVTLPESQHQSRRSTSYSMSMRHSNHEDEVHRDGKTSDIR